MEFNLREVLMKRALLQNKNVVLLLLGKAVSLLGSNMQQFALSLYVLAITGSATIFSTMLAISILPRILLTPFAGVFGDWFDRKKSIITLDFINAVLLGGYTFYFFTTGSLSIGSVYVLVIVLEITEIFFGSAMAAVLPSLVKKEELFDANSLKTMVVSIATMVAPMIAATLYGLLGIQGILLLNTITYALSAFSECFIQIPKFHKRPETINMVAFKKDFIEGLEIIKHHRIIRNIIGLGMVLNFCLGPLFSVGLFYVIKEVHGGSAFQIGLFSSILSLSMVLTPMFLGGFAKKVSIEKLLIYSFFVVSFIIMLLGLVITEGLLPSTSVFLYILLLSFVIGIFVTMANIASGTMFDATVPKEAMGRVGTVMSLLMVIIQPIGQVLMGVAMDWISPEIPFYILGVVMALSVIYYKKPFLQPLAEKEVA